MSRVKERVAKVRMARPVKYLGLEHLGDVIEDLFLSRAFWLMTFLGNGIVFGAALLLFRLERGINPGLHTYLDAVYWGMATVTTVGYGDVSPVTTEGKILAMVLMVLGSTTWLAFTATFASIVLSSRLHRVEEEVGEALKEITHFERMESDHIRALMSELETILARRGEVRPPEPLDQRQSESTPPQNPPEDLSG